MTSQAQIMVGSGACKRCGATRTLPHPPDSSLTSPSTGYALFHSPKYPIFTTPHERSHFHTPGVYIFEIKVLQTFAIMFKLASCLKSTNLF